jgi:hypothetical protein
MSIFIIQYKALSLCEDWKKCLGEGAADFQNFWQAKAGLIGSRAGLVYVTLNLLEIVLEQIKKLRKNL